MKTPRAVTAFLLLGGLAFADDWPAFRGPNGNGLSSEKKAPTVWAPDRNVKWRVPLPQPGNGSPIVFSGRVFVTCPEDPAGLKRSLYCFDRKDGKQLWVKTVEMTKKGDPKEQYTHGANFFSSSTPAADGTSVVVWHDSAGLFCYDLEGKELWLRDLGEFYHLWGHGSSPVMHDGKVFLNCGPGAAIFMTALDVKTGKTLWKTDEPQDIDPDRLAKGFGDKNKAGKPAGSWSTPVVAKVGGREQVICAQPTRLVAYDLADGRILWSCDGNRFEKGDVAYSTPLVAGDVCLAFGGYNGPRVGVHVTGQEARRIWRKDDKGNPQSIGSGVVVDGHAYVPFAGENVVECIDPKTGETLWRERWVGGAFWGSMVQAGGLLYVTDQAGKTCVFRPDPKKFDLVAANPIGEKTNATPAISDGQIFLRTQKSLSCISE